VRVLIVGSSGNCTYAEMFRREGWEVVTDIGKADLIQFTGGEDVTPALYGEKRHPRTYNSFRRDSWEMEIFKEAMEAGIPCAGICRGGQFLNVMNDGAMYQDVDHHAIDGLHEALDVRSGHKVMVTSTHHQMMRPGPKGELLCVAQLASRKDYMPACDEDSDEIITDPGYDEPDVEVVIYREKKCLCFQPHPEHSVRNPSVGDCKDYYFALLKEVLL